MIDSSQSPSLRLSKGRLSVFLLCLILCLVTVDSALATPRYRYRWGGTGSQEFNYGPKAVVRHGSRKLFWYRFRGPARRKHKKVLLCVDNRGGAGVAPVKKAALFLNGRKAVSPWEFAKAQGGTISKKVWLWSFNKAVAVIKDGPTAGFSFRLTTNDSCGFDGGVNQAPRANAGLDETIFLAEGESEVEVTLDGSRSVDPDGTIVEYQWNGASVDPADVVAPSIRLPLGTHVFSLKVVDNEGLESSVDSVTIKVKPGAQRPVADAGPDQMVMVMPGEERAHVCLDGRGSFDPDGFIKKYIWTGNPDPFDTALPVVDLLPGTYVFTLVVKDYQGLMSEPDTVTIIVKGNDENAAPVADAGPDQQLTLAVGQTEVAVQLDGSGSTDSDGTIAEYRWTSAGSVDPEDVVSPTVTLGEGAHEFSLVVVDEDGAESAADTVVVTVNPVPNQAPTANAGANMEFTLAVGQVTRAVTLDGTASNDVDGTIIEYRWTSAGSVDPDDIESPTVQLPAGTHEFALVVVDNDGAESAVDTVVVVINPAANQAPSANAGPDQTVTLEVGETTISVQLDGSGSADVDGTIAEYRWTSAGSVDPADVVSPMVELTEGTHEFSLVVVDEDGAESAADTVVITVNPAQNQAPTANAGPDQTVTLAVGEATISVQLDGSGSADVDGAIAEYRWTSAGSVDPADVVSPTVELPEGTHEFSLVVVDEDGAESVADTVVITVNPAPNQAPTADAGPDQTVTLEVGETTISVQLDGSGSADVDGTIAEYRWASAASVDPADVVSPTVELPEGTHEFSLVVVDEDGAESLADTVVITVNPAPNQAPTADAGPDQTVTLEVGETTISVQLDGSGSADVDGTIAEYRWTSAGSVDPADVVSPTVELPEGTHEFSLVVVDEDGAESLADTVVITVNPAPNQAPTADAGPDQTVTLEVGETTISVQLDGSGSADVDGTIAEYRWTSAGSVDPADVVSPAVELPEGTHEFSLVVVDEGGAESLADTVVITVNPAPNQAPTADAGPDQEVTLANGTTVISVQLDGSGSADVDGTIAEYCWTSAGSVDPADVVSPTVDLTEGIHEFSLVVVDEDGAESAADTVVITVNPPIGPPNEVPVADAGNNQIFVLQDNQPAVEVTLDGSGSVDNDGQIVAYTWTGDSVDPDDVVSPTVSLAPGVYVFRLVVTDDQGAESSIAEVNITVSEVAPVARGAAPVIEVTPPLATVRTGETAILQVTASDPFGEEVRLAVTPLLENATFIANGGTGTLQFTPGVNQQGLFSLKFAALDASGNRTEAVGSVSVTPLNTQPVLEDPADQTIDEGEQLVLQLQTSDADGDNVTVEAFDVPENALFIPATNTLLFTPSFEQADEYVVRFVASDGVDSSAEQSLTITVRDVVEGAPGSPRDLQLEVNQAQTPTLLPSQRITGAVNAALQLPPAGNTEALPLVTSLNPTQVEQGQTVTVTIQGSAEGRFATNFVDGVTTANFGAGITVESVTVTGPSSAEVELSVDEDAEVGQRSVQVVTDTETAISLLAFTVAEGRGSISGVLQNPETGDPIPNAQVSIRGTDLVVFTNADGEFFFFDVPRGAQILQVNAPDFEFFTVPVESRVGVTATVGTIGSEPTVFDPAAEATTSVRSILGRGLGDQLRTPSIEDATQMVIDAILAVGGTEGGVLDEYGTQLNPEVEGLGLVTSPVEIVEQVAHRMATGQTYPLIEYLYLFSEGFDYSGEDPPTLAEWIEAIQREVNRAWANPNEPESRLFLLIFNQRRNIAPEPPLITPSTQLTAAQSFLLVKSFLAYGTLVIEANLPESPTASASDSMQWLRKVEGALISSAYAQSTPDPTKPTFLGRLSQSWAEVMKDEGFKKYTGKVKTTFSSGVNTVVLNALGRESSLPKPRGIAKSFVGAINDLMFDLAVKTIIATKRPQRPIILNAEQQKVLVTNADGTQEVRSAGNLIEVDRIAGDRGAARCVPQPDGSSQCAPGRNPTGLKFFYRLWRTFDGTVSQTGTIDPLNDNSKKLQLVAAGEPIEIGDALRQAESSQQSAGPVFALNRERRLLFVDPDPPQGTALYYVDVVRSIGERNRPAMPGLPWFAKYLPSDGFGVKGLSTDLSARGKLLTGAKSVGSGGSLIGSFNPVGAFTSLMSPLISIAQGIRVQGSRLAGPVPVFNDPEPRPVFDPADGLAIDRGGSFLYVSVPQDNQIEVYTLPQLVPLNPIRAGFIDPNQNGLAIDSEGDLFTNNAASNSRYGGRIFKYEGATSAAQGAKSVAGSTEYYSLQLQFARATQVAALAAHPDDDILVAETIQKRIKKMANPRRGGVNTSRNVAQTFVSSDQFNFNSDTEMVTAPSGRLFVTDRDNILVVDTSANSVRPLFSEEDSPLVRAVGISSDPLGNLYIADAGAGQGEGVVYVIPPLEQETLAAFSSEDPCDLDRLKMIPNVSSLGLIRTPEAGRALYYRTNSTTAAFPFGLSGRILNGDGEPLSGAVVKMQDPVVGIIGPVVTNECGTYHLPGVADRVPRGVLPVTVDITHATTGTTRYRTFASSKGQTFRDFLAVPEMPNEDEGDQDDGELPPQLPPPPPVNVGPLPPGGVIEVDIPYEIQRLPSGIPLDEVAITAPPTLKILSPVDGARLQPGEFTIRGVVDSDLVNTAIVFVNGVANEVPVTDNSFSLVTELAEGPVRIVASAQVVKGEVTPPALLTGASPEVAVQVVAGITATSSITGRVIDPTNGMPLFGVQVELLERGERIFTDIHGAYSFANVPVGGATVAIVFTDSDGAGEEEIE